MALPPILDYKPEILTGTMDTSFFFQSVTKFNDLDIYFYFHYSSYPSAFYKYHLLFGLVPWLPNWSPCIYSLQSNLHPS